MAGDVLRRGGWTGCKWTCSCAVEAVDEQIEIVRSQAKNKTAAVIAKNFRLPGV